AVDQPCLDEDGNPLPAEPTDQGIEYGIDNTTCMFNAFAFGRGNIASATGMSAAFGSSNRIYGTAGYAFGSQNTVTNQALALGEANTATRQGDNPIAALSRGQGAFGAALGASAQSQGACSLAFGDTATAEGLTAVAIGREAQAQGTSALASG